MSGTERKKKEPKEMLHIFTCNFATEWWNHISAENDALSLNKNQETWLRSPQLLPFSLFLTFKSKPDKQTENTMSYTASLQ